MQHDGKICSYSSVDEREKREKKVREHVKAVRVILLVYGEKVILLTKMHSWLTN